jgi:hypothetical protein
MTSRANSSPAVVERPARRVDRARRILINLLLILTAAVGVGSWIWSLGAERRAVIALPDGERRLLYSRTLENVRSCHVRLNQEAFREFCDTQASLLLSFPECDTRCRRLSRLRWIGPQR